MKTILIVGSGAGISLSVAYRFAREGFHILLIARNKESLQELVEKLQQAGFKASYFQCDVANFSEMNEIEQQIIQKYGKIDVLFYNAASVIKQTPLQLSHEKLVEDFKINVVAALNICKSIIPEMKRRNSGALLFTGGGLALKPYYEYASLAIGKAGLRSLVFSLAQELADTKIKVGTVTVAGFVKKGTKFDPDKIADQFWKLYNDNRKDIEIIYE